MASQPSQNHSPSKPHPGKRQRPLQPSSCYQKSPSADYLPRVKAAVCVNHAKTDKTGQSDETFNF